MMKEATSGNTPPSLFDEAVGTWREENGQPWTKLRIGLARANLGRHLPGGSLRILDAGGGAGFESLPLAGEGHALTIVDFSPEMLKAAKTEAEKAGLRGCVEFHLADVSNLGAVFPEEQFDLVLFHNVLQYVGDVPAMLAGLARVLRPGGILSLISSNRYAIPWRAAFFSKDLDLALRQIDARSYRNVLFGAVVNEYSSAEVQAMLTDAGLQFEAYYGIRCLTDYWGDNETKTKPETWAQIEKLEYALTGRFPYNLLARFWQIIAHKT
jgi:S-adenosylmethionine-dependent methyltransferase